MRSLGSFVRYDRDVRPVLLALALIAVLGAYGTREAAGKPARMDMDMLERSEPVQPCEQGKTWKVIETCLGKEGTLKILYETEGVKVVQVAFRAPSTATRLGLYTQREQRWYRAGLFASTSPSNELLGVRAFTSPLGMGVRIDLGQSLRTNVSFDHATRSRGLVRRITSTVCVPSTWQCRAVVTSCEAYVRGRLLWTFQGAVMWHASLGLRLQGDVTRAGSLCMPPRTMIDNGDDG